MPLKTRPRAGESGQLFLKCNCAIVIADNEIDLVAGQIVCQLAQPVHCSRERLALISKHAPAEIENIAVQNHQVSVGQVPSDSIESCLSARSAREKMQIGDNDSSQLCLLAVGAHAGRSIPNPGL